MVWKTCTVSTNWSVDTPVVDLDDISGAGDALPLEKHDQPPATRFQIDCTDAMTHIDAALNCIRPKNEAQKLMGTVYLGVAETTQRLLSNLRAVSDQTRIAAEIKQAKVQMYYKWLEGSFLHCIVGGS